MNKGQGTVKALPDYNLQDCIEESINLKTNLQLQAQPTTAIRAAIGINMGNRLEGNACLRQNSHAHGATI